MDRCIENVIEFILNENVATVTFSRVDTEAGSRHWLRSIRKNVKLLQKIQMEASAHTFQ